MSPEPIHKAPVIEMSGDVILLDIDRLVPQWDLYTFYLDIQKPGTKKVVIRVKRDPVSKSTIQTQTEHIPKDIAIDAAVQTDGLTVELPEPIKLKEDSVSVDGPIVSMDATETFTSCPIVPCRLLVRPSNAVSNPMFPKYMVRPFPTQNEDVEGGNSTAKRADGGTDVELEQQSAKRTRCV